MTVGFDFGTTNSLISICARDGVIDLLGSDDRPYPSVVRYEGERVIVGREARDALMTSGIGVHGNTVMSPKFLLGEASISVGGVQRSPIDIVAAIVDHVRQNSLLDKRLQNLDIGGLNQAVVTIPVTMNGPRRAALREACNRADLSVVQFVHEPLAALYGYLRGSDDFEGLIRKYSGRNVLVVDWGGGTLDLTLCRIDKDRILQLRNGGSDSVGGDSFDQVIRDEVLKNVRQVLNIDGSDQPSHDASLKLLKETEQNKIALSNREEVSFYSPSFFPKSGEDLAYKLSRQELEDIVGPLVNNGMRSVESLLESVGVSPANISLCLITGGMAQMPAIKNALYAVFGADRVVVPPNSATLISQGAAWIANDVQRLVLAKPIELEMARGSRLTLLRAGTKMPLRGELRSDSFDLFCTDPTDGKAKFPIVTTLELPTHPQVSDPRTTLGVISVKVDKSAPKLFERLKLEVSIDQDLILGVRATSTQGNDFDRASFFDLEFGIGFPGSDLEKSDSYVSTDDQATSGLSLRANVFDSENQVSIPGDVLYKYVPTAFRKYGDSNDATDIQVKEHLYYQPCSKCGLKWGDPDCTCAS